MVLSCADPESFVRGVQLNSTFFFSLADDGKEFTITFKIEPSSARQ